MEGPRLIERLETFDVDAADVPHLASATVWIRQVRGYLDSLEGRIARRAEALADEGAGVDTERLLSSGGRASRNEARRKRRRAETLGKSPELDKQLSKGRIGPEHADVVAAAASRLDDTERDGLFACDAELATAAASKTPEQFRRFVNQCVDELRADDGIEESERQRDAATLTLARNEETGMGTVRGDLHPDEYQKLRRALDAEVKALRKLPEHEGKRAEQLRAIALVDLVTGERSTQRRAHAQVLMLIDHQTISTGRHDGSVAEYSDGASVPIETIRRHACDAGILPVVLGGDGVPLDVGRQERLATPEQRAALRSMYRTCAVDGCDRHFDICEIHHLAGWDELDGPTDMANLLPVCGYHHHRAHEGGWRLELDESSRQLTVWLPDGTLHSRCLPDMVEERRRMRPAA